jgi:dTDP-4-dehydrorhamnose reductase
MRFVVTGGFGMLGREITSAFKLLGEVIPLGRCDMDIVNEGETRRIIAESCADWVIHTAACTDVDGCEKEPEKAFLVNSVGTKNVALGCLDTGAKMVYISTDYVFDGKKGSLYTEDDIPNPINVYGSSKLEGEYQCRSIVEDHLIIRTQWLYGQGGKNFVNSILRNAREGKEIRVVEDQVGSPTYTVDLAKGIMELVRRDQKGLFHISNAGVCSWFDFAKKIIILKGLEIEVIPIKSEELKRPARRPSFSGFDCAKFRNITGMEMRTWEEAVQDYISSIT